ncbi:MAG: protein kinase [Bradymonadaceae bacterium]|nr:protein kinase [Lujinxingiaceae bacterium]
MNWRPPRPGEFFEGRYRIEAVLGSGGFAYVFRATQLELGRQVALKILRPFLHTSDMDDTERAAGHYEWVQRFRREAQIVSRLRDPHTITMYEYGQNAEGMSYMAFEYVEGRPLDDVIKEESPLAPKRVANILAQCLSSLQEAHGLGMLHRDMKPANIMLYDHLGRRDHVKVLDFGIAKPAASEDGFLAELTQAGTILGTPRYMSPEQLRGTDIFPSSDLYSLGLVAYELLCGEKAVGGTTTVTIITQQLSPEPIVLPDTVEIPHGLRAIVNRMLAKSVHARFPAASDVLAELDGWKEERHHYPDNTIPNVAQAVARVGAQAPLPPAQQAPRAAQRSAQPAYNPTHANHNYGSPASPKPSSSWPLVAALVAIVLLGAPAVYYILTHEDGPQVLVLGGSSDEANIATLDETRSPPKEDAALTYMFIVTDPSRAELSVNDVVVGTSPMRVSIADFNFPIFVRARMADGREASEALTRPTEMLELRFAEAPVPEPEKLAEPAITTKTSASEANASTRTTSTADKTATSRTIRTTATTRTPESDAVISAPRDDTPKRAPEKKTKSSFPALDSF